MLFNTFAAIGTILLQTILVVLIISILMKASFLSRIAAHTSIALRIIFVVAVVISLIYQYGFGYAPCLLCWYQRIAIFGVAILAFTTDLRTSALLRKQILVFSLAGFVIALFHNYIDIFPSSGITVCGATGPSCLIRYVYVFHYITIPMMSATVLLSGILLSLVARCYPQQSVAVVEK